MWTTTITGSSPLNWAGWYLPLDPAHDGYYRTAPAFITCQHHDGTAQYRIYQYGTGAGVSSYVWVNQAAFCNRYVDLLGGTRYFSAQSGGEILFVDVASVSGRSVVVDLLYYRP